MGDIRYVCVSDLHMGEEDSLLTNLGKDGKADVKKASPVMAQLVECLKHLILKNESTEKPTLILAGDILEMALATTNVSAMVFERFLELVMPPGEELFQEIIYIPGNHDHHMWESAREAQYVRYIRHRSEGACLRIPWHTTSMFVEDPGRRVPSSFLTALAERATGQECMPVTIAYPNFGLWRKDARTCVIFHHGHFIESMYQLMSEVRTWVLPDRKKPAYIWDIEAENFAWIDFFWSTLGRSGDVGRDVELIYEKIHDRKQLEKLLCNLVMGLTRKFHLPGRLVWRTVKLLYRICRARRETAKLERHKTADLLSSGARRGLRAYMDGPLWKQMQTELGGCEPKPPGHVTFVLGHTHKPFEEDMNGFERYPDGVRVYNTGGWVVDTVERQSQHGGAVILIDEDLNAASVRMYNEADDPKTYSVEVTQANPGEKNNPLYERIRWQVDPSEDPWKAFSDTVADEVPVRAQHLHNRIESDGDC